MKNKKQNHCRTGSRQTATQRSLRIERLEFRELMAADLLNQDLRNIWERMDALPTAPQGAVSYLNAANFTAWSINKELLSSSLKQVPLEFTQPANTDPFIFHLPTPSGSLSKFSIFESPIMEPALASQFPEIKTFRGQGIDDPAATLRFDISPFGLRAQVLSPNGAFYIDPYWHQSDHAYVSYFKRDLFPSQAKIDSRAGSDVVNLDDPWNGSPFGPSGRDGNDSSRTQGGGADNRSAEAPLLGRSGTELRTYRLANAATGEYTQFHGGTVAGGQAAIVTTINRVNGIYERELAVRMVLVGSNSSLVYTDPATDPYTNDNGLALLSENQTNIDRVIGDANYDIGHVFNTGGGGLAGLGVVGISGLKARGQTGSPQPIGDPFDVDYVAHEIGHQFGGRHTFNGTSGACGGSRSPIAAYEPGSGSTIMAYAGICGTDDLQRNSDPYFHSYSFDEIVQFSTSGVANAAAVITNTGNRVPQVYAGKDHVIPTATPFNLDAIGKDQDTGNVLSYQWEQRDLGPAQQITDPDNGRSPLFRSWNPTTDTGRTLPRLSELLNNTAPLGERLPTTNRTLNFRAIVRDNFGGGGGVNTDDMQITVVDTGSPFSVTSPNTPVSLIANSQETVTWNVSGTNSAPINESHVDIWLSLDGGLTFPILLAGATPNDGTETIQLPSVTSTRARVKVAARENIFFDVSNANFSIDGSTNIAPTISNISNLWMSWNTASPLIPFRIGDAETPADNLVVTAFAVDGTLIPSSRIEVGGTGANRSIRIRPAAREFGETQIFVGVTDEQGVTSFETFLIYVEADSSTEFGISVSNLAIEYTENSPSIPVTDSATVIDNIPGDYSTGSLLVNMAPINGATDELTLDYSSTPSLTQIGAIVFFRGLPVANFRRTSNAAFQFAFNASTSLEAIEAIVRSIRFSANGDAPDTSLRSVSMTLTKGANQESTFVDVKVISVNDRPIAIESFMDEIDEDATNHSGNTVAQLVDRGVVDPDATRGTGIVLTGVAPGPGRWQYNMGTGWIDIANLSPSNGLVLGLSSRVRFVPAQNFFGDAPVLSYYALDTLYQGGFSSAAGVVRANIQNIDNPTSISVTASGIRQVVRPVNDAPSAVSPFPTDSATQDEPFFFEVPSSLFTDFDDSELTLSALTAAGRPLPSWLSFDPITRTFRGTPRNQDVGQQQFLIRAMDASGAFADAPFIIDVVNVNDAPNDLRLLGQPVLENARGARIGRLTVLDPDPNDSHTWSVTDPRFEVRGNDLFLVSLSSLNFELEPNVQLAVRVTDDGLPRLSFETTVTIPVSDINEFAPQLSPLTLSVNENATSGSFVGQVFATDGDTANRIRYRFFGAAPSEFQLQPDTGVLSVRPGVTLDYETTPNYQFFVETFDDGVPSLSTWVSVDVALRDINEFAPVITTQSLNVSEDTAIGRAFGRVAATDGDKHSITFSLPTTETRFSIDSVTGELRLNRADVLDFERSSSEQVTVIATDSGTPGLSSQRQIILQVLNANEPPTSMSVENTKVLANLTGINLGRITVQDPDGPTGYAIIMPLDSRFEVVEGNLVLGKGQYLKGTDPSFITVPFLLRETAGGPTYRLDIQLERLLNPTPWRNSAMPFDVDRSGDINPLDVLAVINVLNSIGAVMLPIPRDSSSLNSADVDVDGDGRISPLDVLAIINALNGPLSGGEGESARASQATEVDSYFAQFDADSDPLISRHPRTGRRFWR